MEFSREVAGGVEIFFRPVHMSRVLTMRLECGVRIDEATGGISQSCRCEAAAASDD